MDPHMQPNQKYAIGAFAKLTGVTERALRYYDRKGLLAPSIRNEHGHRFYTEQDLLQLQKILTLKYLDFSLEEIGSYLERPEVDLQHSLAAQYEMLQQKQRQLERVMETISRMRKLVEGAGKVDSHLLLVFIHSIQHEEVQKQWLSRQMPSSVVDAIYMKGMSKEERLEQEKQMIAILLRMKELHKQGMEPSDEKVAAMGMELLFLLESLLSPVIKGLSEQELAQIEAIGDIEGSIDPFLFPNAFTKEEEVFFASAFEHLEALKKLAGGDVRDEG
ncbi:MerR family transcriptional regulator [Paenibacillus harenae]|uniref:DNA-binding transcriptional MerR regulator n=1 Tax=Paenibacillus harenae TaxID=306543 RepID=A0ABT9U8T0_PAEHA|nr:MerR family transcriptional regulator [Paenibacillus harenae]MDQ0115662.1 DNA-binding transcriptional MerR regulator [Paenibacillus harenae]